MVSIRNTINKVTRLYSSSLWQPTINFQCKRLNSDISIGSRQHSAIFEVAAGIGGIEASLFAREMLAVYQSYFDSLSWNHSLETIETINMDGCHKAVVCINNSEAYQHLMYEAGIHRVQRNPKTDRSRIHTSTITIAIIPKAVYDFKLNEKDVLIESCRSSGPGGQHVNKINTAVHATHKPTGIVAECQVSRHQYQNRKIAIEKLEEKISQSIYDDYFKRINTMRKSQVKHADRSDKIRTYNYPNDRIVDHRTKKSYQNLKSLIDCHNPALLAKIINDLHKHEL